MRIQKLILKNFSSHVSTEINIETSVVLIVGTLAAGKSSLINALEFALTGECAGIRKRTDDRSELVYDMADGTGPMKVDLTMDKGHAERGRGRNGNSEILVWNGQVKQSAATMDQAVTEALGVSKTVISSVLNVSNFFDLEPAEQKQLIIGLIGAEVTHEKVLELFTEDKAAFGLIEGRIDSLQALQNAYQYAYDRRTVVNRELKALKPPDPPEGPAPPIEKIRTLLDRLEKELQEQISIKGKFEGAGDTTAIRERLQNRIAELKKVPKKSQGDRAELQQMLDVETTARAQATQFLSVVEGNLTRAKAKLLASEKNVALLTNFNGFCVAGDHACPAPKEDMATALKLQTKQQKTAAQAVEQLETELQILRERRDDDKSIQEAKDRIRAHEDAVTAYTRAGMEIAAMTKELESLSATAPDAAEIATVNGAIDTLRGRIVKGRVQLESAAAWLERDRAVKAVAEQRAKLERERAQLETLVDFLGPKGCRVALIDERIGFFIEEINAHLAHFGFSVSIQLEPWRIYRENRTKERLSRSERFRMSLGFQIAIAKMTGLNFVCCDDVDILVSPAARKAAIEMIVASGVNAILAMAIMVSPEEFKKRKPHIPGLSYLLVTNNGGVSHVEQI